MKRRARAILLLSVTTLAAGGCALMPAPQDFPAEADGNPVLSVSQAIAARDGGASGPIAIGGWFSMAPAHPCPAPIVGGVFREPNPLELYCREGDWALAEQPEAIVDVTIRKVGDSTSIEVRGRSMTGPWLQPVLGVASSEIFPAGVSETWHPVPVVLIGRFRDARAATCRAEIRDLCFERFVVDKVRRP